MDANCEFQSIVVLVIFRVLPEYLGDIFTSSDDFHARIVSVIPGMCMMSFSSHFPCPSPHLKVSEPKVSTAAYIMQFGTRTSQYCKNYDYAACDSAVSAQPPQGSTFLP